LSDLRAGIAAMRRRSTKAIKKRMAGPAPDRRGPAAKPSTDALGPLRPFESLLPNRRRRVVVVAHPTLREQVGPWLSAFGKDDRFVISADTAPEWELGELGVAHRVAQTSWQISWEIKLIGPVDVIVNLLPHDLLPSDSPNHHELWWRLYFHLKPGGLYILGSGSPPGPEIGATVGEWIARAASPTDPESVAPPSAKDAELIRSTGAAAMSRELIATQKRGKHYLKLRDAETNRTLVAREPRIAVRELAKLPAGEVTCRAVVTSHESSVEIDRLPESLPYPELHLRHYQGRIAFSGSTLMYGEYTILPDSFRHHLAANASNARITNVSGHFARIPDALRPRESLAGNYYQLDSTFAGHFGHFTTEVLSRFWGWDQAKAAFPDLKVLLRKHPKELTPSFELRFFQAYGISPEDVVWTDTSVYLESVISATPMWHNEAPYYVQPDLATVWERIGRSLVDPAGPTHERIFVSRGGQWDRRNCRNKSQVEAFFAAHGFTVVYPEDLDLAEQAGLFARATVIAGFGGSGMFNMMFARKMTTAIILSHEAYTARNEHLFTSVLGGNVHYFWSTPDIPHPERGWSQDAFYSDWEFDFERNQVALEKLLSTL
jgi:capsular polysaccharide biosynthesis protein